LYIVREALNFVIALNHETNVFLNGKAKVKKSLYSPEQAPRVPGSCGSQTSRQLAHEGGKVVWW
jgi:hypothetical protein